MSWPRKNEKMRLYRERDGSYLAVLIDNGQSHDCFDVIANVYRGPEPSLVGTSISKNCMAHPSLKRVQWDELPDNWQRAFRFRLDEHDQPFDPARIRGFWRIGNQPA